MKKTSIVIIMLWVFFALNIFANSALSQHPEGLIHYWKLEDGTGTIASDSVGTNHGTVHGATWTSGIVNGALSFDGADDYVEAFEISGSDYNNFTIAFWFKTNTDYSNIPPNENPYDYWYNIFGSGIGYVAIMPSEPYGGVGDAGAILFVVYPERNGWCACPPCGYGTICPPDGEPAYFLRVTDVINKDQWHFAVLTSQGDNAIAYLDGIAIGTLTYDDLGISANHNFTRIGVDTSKWYDTINQLYHFDGTIDEVRIYNRALSEAEIQELYEEGQDADGDGVTDDEDECPDSDLSEIVVIDGCDSGVENILVENGCSISDLIDPCADGAENHGEFVSCVSGVTNGLKASGYISGKEKGKIQRCAARSNIP